MANFHDLDMLSISGESIHFSQYKDRLCLVVNVASA